MKAILERIFVSIRVHFFPTENDRIVKQWIGDAGDTKLRLEFTLNSNSLVIDLGGYKGQWASDIYAMYKCRILVFEPVKAFADNIKRRFSNNPDIEVFNVALGNTKRNEEIYLAENGSSVFKKKGEKETISFEDVTSFFANRKITTVDLMKMNIEGGEYELLERMIGTGIIQQVKQLQVQFHKIDDNSFSQMKSIKEQLAKTHKQTFAYKFVWENWILKDKR